MSRSSARRSGRRPWSALDRLRPVGEDGLTLAELMITIMVGTLVLTACAVIFQSALQSNTVTQRRVDTVNSARVAMDSLTRSLRTAVLPSQLEDVTNTDAAFLSAQDNSVSFYANLQNEDNVIGPSRVTYAVAAQQLTQSVQKPNAHAASDHDYTYCSLSAPGCTATTRVLSPNVSTAARVFTYYRNDGAVLAPTGACTCLSPADLLEVDSVEIRLVVTQASPSKAAPTTYISRVSLPNHDAIPRQEVIP